MAKLNRKINPILLNPAQISVKPATAVLINPLDVKTTIPSAFMPVRPAIDLLDLAIINPRSKGIPREKIKVPLAPNTSISDTILYEDSKDATKKLYLPRYKVATQRVSGKAQFRIALAQNSVDSGGQLIVYLEKFPAPEIETLVTNATHLPHRVQLSLNFQAFGGITKSLRFQEISQEQALVKAVLKVPGLGELNQLATALNEASSKAELLIQRHFQVATPIYGRQKLDQLNPNKHKPILVLNGKEDYEVRGKEFTRYKLAVQNYETYPNQLFAASPDLPPCGGNKKASRTWVDIYSEKRKRLYGFCALSKNEQLQNLWFALPRGEKLDFDKVYIVLQDRRKKQSYTSTFVSLSGRPISSSPLYQVKNKTLTTKLTCLFPKAFHAYIYRELTGDNTQMGGFIAHRITWKGKEHFYLQDEVRKERFLFLPDEFRLARVDGFPKEPNMLIEYRGNSRNELHTIVEYNLSKFVDSERLAAAFQALKEKVETALADKLMLESLIVSKDQLTYKLALPEGNGFSERPNASVQLNEEGIKDILPPIPIEAFATIFDKLMDRRSGNILTGEVEIRLPGMAIPSIPVSIRFDNLLGQVFAIEETFDASTKQFQVKLTNVIESPVLVNAGLKAFLQDETTQVTTQVQGLTFPLLVAPGESVPFKLIPEDTLPNMEQADTVIEWEGMEIQLDKMALYDAVISESIQETYREDIEVTVFANDPSILAIEVNFSNSDKGAFLTGNETFKKSEITNGDGEVSKVITLTPPIRDYILHQFEDNYWYQVTVQTLNGKLTSDWLAERGDLIINATTFLNPA